MDISDHLRMHRRNRLRGSTVRFEDEEDKVVHTWVGPVRPQLYGEDLQSLCHRTSDNIERLRSVMVEADPCYEYGIKHWHSQNRPKSAMDRLEDTSVSSVSFKGGWKDPNVMFTETMDTDLRDEDSISNAETSLPPNKFCYLCTTMEEHQRHMHLHKMPKRTKGKAKIQYIAPRPTIKKKEEEVIDTTVYDRLYKVDVYTGESGINAKVHITIKGSRDELKRTELKKGCGSMNFIFMRETKETFYLKGPFLGNLEIVTIEHDGLMPSHKWFLEKIVITDVKTEHLWEFECNNWLSLHIKDYRIKRDLFGKEKGKAAMEVYVVQIFTGKKAFSGTDANICMTIFGTKGATNKLKFVDHDKSKFEKGKMDKFEVSCKNLGELRRIRVEHDAKGFASGWFLDKVIIYQRDNPRQQYYFLYDGWIGKDVGEGVLYRDIQAKKHLPKEKDHGQKTNYIVYVKTGDKRFAGTDANVFVQIMGEKSMTKKHNLDDEKNNFERGMLDVFQYEDIDVGPIKAITIGHDNSGPGAGWYLEQVTIKRYLQRKEIATYLKQTKKEAEKITKRKHKHKGDDVDELEERMKKLMNKSMDDLSDDDLKKRKGRKDKENRKMYRKKSAKSDSSDEDTSDDEIHHQRKSDKIKLKVPLYEECVFPCNQWFAKDEGDGLFVRELKVKDRTMFYKN